MKKSLHFLTRSCFAVAEILAPRTGARAAFWLFRRTGNPNRISVKEKRRLDQARPLMQGGRVTRLVSRSWNAIAAYEFSPVPDVESAPTALVIHGWRSRSAHLAELIDGLRQRGFRVVAIDLPGHGNSAGRRLDMAMAVAAVHAAQNRFGPFSAIVGHSFGGAVAVNAVSGSIVGLAPVETNHLVLIAAPSSMPEQFDRFGNYVGLGERTRRALGAIVTQVTGNHIETFVGANQLAKIPVPTLVLHAPDDRIVPFSEAKAFASAGSHVRLSWSPGLGHQRIVRDSGIIRQIGDFVAGHRHLMVVSDRARLRA